MYNYNNTIFNNVLYVLRCGCFTLVFFWIFVACSSKKPLKTAQEEERQYFSTREAVSPTDVEFPSDISQVTESSQSNKRNRNLITDDDLDGDGVPNDRDSCENTTYGHPVDRYGCSTIDKDQDGVCVQKDADDNLPGPPECYGVPCSEEDSDGDGVPDRLDHDPDHAGSKINHGIPTLPSEEEWARFSFENFSSDPNPEDLNEFRLKVAQLKRSQPSARFLMIGLTDGFRESKNIDYAKKRLRVIRDELLKLGIDDRAIEEEPQFSSDHFSLNRAVFVYIKRQD